MKGLYLFLKKKKIDCRLTLFTKDKLKIIEKFNPEVVIFDLSSYKKFKIDKLLNSKKLKVLTIENFDNSKYDLNLSVFDHNQNLNSRRVEGLKYAMIRPEIIKSKTKIEKKLIMVNLGSTENIKKIKEISSKLIKLSMNYKIIVVTKFYNLFSKKNTNIKYVSKKNFLKYFTSSVLNVTNGGLTSLESIYLNKKTIILPQTKKEKILSSYLSKKTKIITIGCKSIQKNNIDNLIRINNKNKIVDGLGYQRIYKLILKI